LGGEDLKEFLTVLSGEIRKPIHRESKKALHQRNLARLKRKVQKEGNSLAGEIDEYRVSKVGGYSVGGG